MMRKTYDQSIEINHNQNLPYIPDHLFNHWCCETTPLVYFAI